MALISNQYRYLMGQTHHTDIDFGIGAGAKAAHIVRDLMGRFGTRDVLDYGCGKGTLAAKINGIKNYDPALIEFCALPAKADLVICRDVMEHVEEDCIDEVLDHIKALAKRAAWFTIVCRPARKVLPDGRNAHISIFPPHWWIEKLHQRFAVIDAKIKRDDLEALCE